MNAPIFAPAKVNLWLRIFPPDETGYHPLDSLFCAVDLADELTIELGGQGIRLNVTGADVGPAERNLAYRAAQEFFAATGLPDNVGIQLQKKIPAGGGMGGGSSDAAAVLRTLNALHDDVLPQPDLMAMGARIGSDVAFFLCGSPWAHATGRGEILQAVVPLPPAPLLIVVPAFAIATPHAYRWLDEARAWSRPAEGGGAFDWWAAVHAAAHNDFERVLFDRHPALRVARDALRAAGAACALVSGSGSALFGVFEDAAARDHARRALQTQLPDMRSIAATTLDVTL